MKLVFHFVAGICLVSAISKAHAAPERWQPPVGEFSVEFSGKPETGETAARPAEGVAHLDLAAYGRPGLIERAEASLNQRTKPITQEEAQKLGEAWAKMAGVTNPKMSFDGFHLEDRKLTLKGTWTVEGAPMSVMSVFHWGKRTFLLLSVSEPPNAVPSADAARFIASVKQSFQASLTTGK